MYILRAAEERGRTYIDWLDSRHTFSFGQYFDPNFMGFSDLRVINDDVVEPGKGFGTHPHRDMEIVSVVVGGALEHKDSMGSGEVLRVGEVQRMSAGTGVYHSEFNHSSTEPVHFLQIWILPEKNNLNPEYEQKFFPEDYTANRLGLIISREGREKSLRINQDVEIYQCKLEKGHKIEYPVDKSRKYWLQMIAGKINVNGHPLSAGDGLAVSGEENILEFEAAEEKSNFLFFNLRP